MLNNLEKDEIIKNINIDGIESYLVTSYGRVFNGSFEELTGTIDGSGYITVGLSCYGKTILYKIHRLVCITFIGKQPSEDKYMVDHINRNKTNNKMNNLRWATPSENGKKQI